jgi:Hpt domain
MDGYTATRMLRQRGFSQPVLALTAHAMKGVESEIQHAGFDAHLTKPVDVDALLAELGRRLESQCYAGAASTDNTNAAAAPRVSGPIESRLAQHPRLRRTVRTFALALPRRLLSMEDALRLRRFDKLAGLAHWLKGSGGTVGYDVFFEPARQLEADARAERVESIEAGLKLLRDLTQRLVIPDEMPAAVAPPAETAPTA